MIPTPTTAIDLAAQHNDPDFPGIWEELNWRGLVHVSTDQAALQELLDGEPITFYCGFDPTAASLHLGHLVQLLTMRRLQLAGHRPLGLVGGSTGLIGDPRQTSERVLNTREVVEQWVGQLREQIERFLSFDGDSAARMVNNMDWTGEMSAIDFLRDIGKHFRVNQMVKKDAVAARLESQEGISYTEFSYQILQALDYLHLYREYGCTLQTGGQDQWGNLTAGADLIHRAEGGSAHVLTTPLIEDENGQKYGKSEGNAVWLSAELTSPYAFYQYWLNVADSETGKLLRVFTDRSKAEIEALEESARDRPHLREAQRALAADVTTLVHGADSTAQVEAASRVLFGRADPHELTEDTLVAATAELSGGVVAPGADIVEVLVTTGLADSKGAARRIIGEGGASVNNVRVDDPAYTLTTADFLHGRVALVRRGRKTLAAARRAT